MEHVIHRITPAEAKRLKDAIAFEFLQMLNTLPAMKALGKAKAP